MERILFVAAWVVSTAAGAQPGPDPQRPLREALAAIEVNARAIHQGDEDLATIQGQLYLIAPEVYRLPALTVEQPLSQSIETRIQEDLGALQADVASQDRDSAIRHAGDLLSDAAELRSAMGLTP